MSRDRKLLEEHIDRPATSPQDHSSRRPEVLRRGTTASQPATPFKDWDPTETPRLLFGSAWTYDWTVFRHGLVIRISDAEADG